MQLACWQQLPHCRSFYSTIPLKTISSRFWPKHTTKIWDNEVLQEHCAVAASCSRKADHHRKCLHSRVGFIPHSTGMPLWGVLPSLMVATKPLYKGVLYFFLSQCIHHYIILTFSSKTHLYDCRDSCCREGKMMVMPRNTWPDRSIWIHMMILQGGGGGKSPTKQLQEMERAPLP